MIGCLKLIHAGQMQSDNGDAYIFHCYRTPTRPVLLDQRQLVSNYLYLEAMSEFENINLTM